MLFVTYLFDLIAYYNLARFMTNSTFNPTCVDDGSVNEYVCVCVCMYVTWLLSLKSTVST